MIMVHFALGALFGAVVFTTVWAQSPADPSAPPSCCLRTNPIHSIAVGVYILSRLLTKDYEVSIFS